MKKGFIGILTILFFCNFGRVEYSALNPKAKTIQTDSSARMMANKPQRIVSREEGSPDQDVSDTTEEQMSVAKYIATGIKLLFATLLKLLVA